MCIFQGLLKNIIIRSVALVKKSYWLFYIFFHRPDFFPPCTLPYKLRKKCFNKNPLLFIKSKKIHSDSVKNERTKKLEGRAPNATPPPSMFRVKNSLLEIFPYFLNVNWKIMRKMLQNVFQNRTLKVDFS